MAVNVSRLIDRLTAEYKLICKEVPDFKQFDEKSYIKARVLTITRTFKIKKTTDADDSGMGPFVDMMNHKPPGQNNVIWTWDDTVNGKVVKAVLDIRRGEEIFISYGERSNTDLLTVYGFTLPENSD